MTKGRHYSEEEVISSKIPSIIKEDVIAAIKEEGLKVNQLIAGFIEAYCEDPLTFLSMLSPSIQEVKEETESLKLKEKRKSEEEIDDVLIKYILKKSDIGRLLEKHFPENNESVRKEILKNFITDKSEEVIFGKVDQRIKERFYIMVAENESLGDLTPSEVITAFLLDYKSDSTRWKPVLAPYITALRLKAKKRGRKRK